MTDQTQELLSIKNLFEAYGLKVLDLISLADTFSIPYSGKGDSAKFSQDSYSKMEAHLRMMSSRKQGIKQYLQIAKESARQDQKSAEPRPQENPSASQQEFSLPNFDSQSQATGNQQVGDQASFIAQTAQRQAANALASVNVLTAYYIQNPGAISDPESATQIRQSQEFLGKSLTNTPLITAFSLPALLNQVGQAFDDQTLLSLPMVKEAQQLALPALKEEEF
jgi:hypothetical protein